VQHLLGFGGSDEPRPDVTFAGCVPPAFFAAAGDPAANGLAVPIVFDADERSPVPGFDVLSSPEAYSDVDEDRNADTYAIELYFSDAATYVTDETLGSSLAAIDLESIVLHELGHALGMDHFGRSEIILDEELRLRRPRRQPPLRVAHEHEQPPRRPGAHLLRRGIVLRDLRQLGNTRARALSATAPRVAPVAATRGARPPSRVRRPAGSCRYGHVS